MKKPFSILVLLRTFVMLSASVTLAQAQSIALTSGDGQTAVVATTLPQPFVVTVTDGLGAPAPDVQVTFAIASVPSGSAGTVLTTLSATTDGAGQARSTLTLGDKIGPYSVTATSVGMTGSPITFNATAIAGQAKNITLISGSAQTGQVQATLSNPLIVLVTDSHSNPVQGAPVTFAFGSLPAGTIGAALGTSNASTNLQGLASTTVTLGTISGSYPVTATSLGLTGSPVAFTETATPGPAAKIQVETQSNGNGQIAPLASQDTITPGAPITMYAITRDANNNFIANTAADSWNLVGNTAGIKTTDLVASSDRKSAVFTGHLVGTTQIVAPSGSLSAIPTLAIRVIAGLATKVRIETLADGTGQIVPLQPSITSGTAFTAYSITRDAFDNFVANVAADVWSLQGSTGGVVSGDLAASSDRKSAVFTGHSPGTTTIRATFGALTPENSGTITVTLGAPSKVVVEDKADGSGAVIGAQSLLAGRSITMYAISRDINNNFVANIAADTWSLLNPGGGIVVGDLVASGDKKSAVFTGHVPGTTQIQVTSTGLTPTPSQVITVTLGTPARVVVETKSDGSGVVVPLQSIMSNRSITVYSIVRDSANNFIGNNPATAWSMQSKNLGVADSDLVASTDKRSAVFTGGAVGTGQIQAAITGLTSVRSGTLTVTPGTAAYVRVETKADGSGAVVPPQTVLSGDSIVVYSVSRDSSNNFLANVAAGTWSLQSRTGGVLASDLAASPDMKSAHFRAKGLGTAQIQATYGTLSPVLSGTITSAVGAAAKLRFLQEPTMITSGGIITPAVTVRIEDVNGNLVTGDTRNVTVSLLNNPPGGALGGTRTLAAVGGIATFATLTVDKSDSTYTLLATSVPILLRDTSAVFIVNPGPIAGFTIEAAGGGAIPAQSAGTPFNVKIAARDAAGNVATNFTGTAIITATTPPGALAIGGGTTASFTNGILASHTVSITAVGSFYLAATRSGGFETGMSNTFTVGPGAPGQVVFVQQPHDATAGLPISPSVTVQLQDALGNNIKSSGTLITMTMSSGSGSLSGTKTRQTDAEGIATFNNLTIDSAGTKRLRAASGTVTAAISDTFHITPGAANRLAFSASPGPGTAGAPFPVQPVVVLQDQFGNTVKGSPETVTLVIQNNPSAGVLGGTRTQAVNTSTGQASFTDLSIDKSGTGYTLTATGTTVSTVPGVIVSAPFAIAAGAPVKLAFSVQPTSATAGANISPAVVVQVQDAQGNLVSINDTLITMIMDSVGTLGGNITQSTVTGAATFNDLRIDKAGIKTLRATGVGLAQAVSNTFAISAAAAGKLAFTTSPGNGTAGIAFPTQPVVTLQDQFGNTVRGTAQMVTVSIKDSAGAGAALSGIKSVPVDASTGFAAFTNLSLDKSGTGFTLTATGSTVDTGRGVAVSNPFNIVPGTPRKLRIESLADGKGARLASQSVSSGVPIVVYAISRDSLDNFVANVPADSWTLVDMAGGAIAADLIPAADKKGATFTGGITGSSSRIAAALAGLLPDTSGVLNVVTPGPPTRIRVETSPNGTGTVVPAAILTSGSELTAYAVERDAANNFVANVPADAWSLAVASGGISPADLTPSADKKSVKFTAHVAGKAQIVATIGSLVQVPSDTIRVTPGSPRTIAVSSGAPDSTRVNTEFASRLAAIVRDSSGNPVPGVPVTYTSPVSGPASHFEGSSGTVSTDSTGIAWSPVVKANTVIGTFADTAWVTGITTPALFVLKNLPGLPWSITPNAGTTPQTTPVSTAFPINLSVAVKDTFGNPVDSVLVSFSVPPSGASGTFAGNIKTAKTNLQGIATAPLFVANYVAGTYTVDAAVSGIVTPASFRLTNMSGPAGSVTATGGTPQSAPVVAPFATRLQALVKDGAGNTVSNVVVRFSAPLSGPSGTFPGGLSDTVRTNSSGVATAPVFTANSVAGTFEVTAAVDSVAANTKFLLTNVPGVLDTFFVEADSGGIIGQQTALVPFAIRVTAKDQYLNTATGFTGTANISGTGLLLTGGGKSPAFSAGVLASYLVRTQNATSNGDPTFAISATRTGGAESGTSNLFSVVNPAPRIKTISPSNGNAGQALAVTIAGTGFISGTTTVSFGDLITTSTTVKSDTVLQVNIRIDALAALGPRPVTIYNEAPGGGLSTGTFTVGDNPKPKIDSLKPNTGAQLQSLAVVLHGSNFLSNGVSRVTFVGGIVVDSITVDSSSQITASITIPSSVSLGQHDVVVRNSPPGGGSDTLKSGFLVTVPKLDTPVLIAPPRDTTHLPMATAITFSWQAVPNASRYHIQISPSSAFSAGSLVVDDSTSTTTSKQISMTSADKFYWRVRARSGGGTSDWAEAWAFTNIPLPPAIYNIKDTVVFAAHAKASDYASTDYRLVGLPGGSYARPSALIPGTYGTDWQMYWDNGASANYLVPFAESDTTFRFAPGRGFWLIKKGSWTVEAAVNFPVLDTSSLSARIPLHSGWNIISNPFLGTMDWGKIQTLNNVLEALWAFPGGNQGPVTSQKFEPYKGYYFLNDPARKIDTLKLPWKYSLMALQKAVPVQDSTMWQVWVDLQVGEYLEQTTGFGVSARASLGKDALDFHKPRGMGELPSTYFSHPEWDPEYSTFATDMQPANGMLHTWNIEFASQGVKQGRVALAFRGAETVPPEFAVYLIDEAAATYRNIRETGRYEFVPSSPLMHFRIVAGSAQAVQEILKDVAPRTFVLEQNYPNPFNPSTSIPVSVPKIANVTLKIYNILGAEVATVFAGTLQPGRYRFQWDGTNAAGLRVSTGVYFVRFATGTGENFVGKMLLMK